jgi:hypothetical protein
MVSALIAFGLLALQTSPNLVANSSLERGLEGWSPVWARTEGAAKAEIVPGRIAGEQAILVTHRGTQDWALPQKATVPVQPGDLYQLSAWMKCEGGSGFISTVASDGDGQTLNWELGKVGPAQSGWQLVKRLFVVPQKCRTLQFRIEGYDAGQTWVESPSLSRTGVKTTANVAPVTLANPELRLTIRADGSMIASPKTGRPWAYHAWSDDIALKSLTRRTGQIAEIEAFDLGNGFPLTVEVALDAQRPEVEVSFRASGPMDSNLALPGSLVTEPGQWVVLPMNEGIRFPVEDPTINGWSLSTYGGHGLCMPWSGVFDPSSGAATMTVVETPDDADVLFQQEEGHLTFLPRWEPSRLTFSYPRKLRLCYFSQGGYVAMAKRYRNFAKATGLFKTLAAKKRENPNVDRLIGAVNVWNWDMEKVALCQEMKSIGFDRVLWSNGGSAEEVKAIADLGYLPGRYDIYQDVWDPKNSLSWMNTKGWPEDLVLLPNGDWMKGWAHPDRQPDGSIKWYQGGVICSEAGLARAKEDIPKDLGKVPYLARFIDTTTASPFRECYNPLHPLTRSQDRQNKMALLDFCSKDMKLVTGSETGIDPSVPVVDYYEGMMSLGPFRLPDSGTLMMDYRKPTADFLKYQVGSRYRIPLWELVYHDCTVAQWYWGDATNKAPEVWDQRDLLNILYGTAPLLMFDKERWRRDKTRMLQTYRNVCEWTRKIGYDEMLSHQDLTPDHTVQKTTWSSGRSAIVNFGNQPWHGMAPMSFQLG